MSRHGVSFRGAGIDVFLARFPFLGLFPSQDPPTSELSTLYVIDPLRSLSRNQISLLQLFCPCTITKAAMAPRKQKKEKLEDDVEMDDTVVPLDDLDGGEGIAEISGEHNDKGDGTGGIDGQLDAEQTLVEPGTKKKSPRVLKTTEEKDANKARANAATEAVSLLHEFSRLVCLTDLLTDNIDSS